jgi:hypothetical protein
MRWVRFACLLMAGCQAKLGGVSQESGDRVPQRPGTARAASGAGGPGPNTTPQPSPPSAVTTAPPPGLRTRPRPPHPGHGPPEPAGASRAADRMKNTATDPARELTTPRRIAQKAPSEHDGPEIPVWRSLRSSTDPASVFRTCRRSATDRLPTCTNSPEAASDHPAKSSTTFRRTQRSAATTNPPTITDLRIYLIVQSANTTKR